MFISIIVPTLNEENYIGRLLDDLSNQSVSKDMFEVIIIDGESSDSTLQRADSYKDKLEIHTDTTVKRSAAMQRNIGADIARGDLYIFLDADISVPKTFIENIHKAKLDEGDPFSFPVHTFWTKDKKIREVIFLSLMNFFTRILLAMNFPANLGSSIIITRKLFEKMNGFRGYKLHAKGRAFPEDSDILIRSFKSGATHPFLKNVVVYYSFRRHNQKGWIRTLILYSRMYTAILFKKNYSLDATLDHDFS